MHLGRNTILHLLEIIGLDESSPYLINKLKDEKIEKEGLKKYSNNSMVKIPP